MSTLNQEKIIASIIIPIRNEENYIVKCIDSLLRQDYSSDKMEFIFVDGISTDCTKDIIQNYANKYPSIIKIFDNPHKTVPFAMNIGIKNAKGKYIIRMDAHSEYACDYISKCMYYLSRTKAANVGGPMVAKFKSSLQEVIAASYSSKIALGGGRFHDENYEGYADTVYLGAFRKDVLFKIGLYDEKFTRNQDDELNFRLIQSGEKIFITPKIRSTYYPRDTYRKLFSQYYQYGWWKVAVLRKHGKVARFSHIIPGIFILFLLLGGIMVWSIPSFMSAYFSVLFIYLMLLFYAASSNQKVNNLKKRLRLIWVIFVLHSSYGLGFIAGIFKICKR